MGLLSKIIRIPTISKMTLEILKKRVFKPFQIPLEEIIEKQEERLKKKFRRMEGTGIGKKLGVHRGVKLQELPITSYEFYKPFYDNPSPNNYMYPLEDYIRIKTSGTSGKEKWFMVTRESMLRSFRETGITVVLGVFHDGEKITLDHGDNLYVNMAPGPFLGSTLASMGAKENPFFNFVPNLNLSYKDKVQYFILNHEKIDAAIILASTLVSQVMPAIGKPIKLKGLLVPDSNIGKIYRDEIEKFTGTKLKNVYASTETRLCTIPSIQYSLGFIFDWRRGVFEFLPEENGKKSVAIDDVKFGEVYQLVYTDFQGELTRYGTKDSFICVAKGDDILNTDCPVFKFFSRSEKTIILQSFTRISEEELLTAFSEAGIPYIDFTTRVEVEGGFEYLIIYLEYVGSLTVEKIQKSIHEQLYGKDKDYHDLVDFFDYVPIKIRLVPRGVFAKYLEGIPTGGFPKVDKINMSDKEFERLMRLIKEQ